MYKVLLLLASAALLGCGTSGDGGEEDASTKSECTRVEQYARCNDPDIPGGGHCIDGTCMCIADGQCYIEGQNGNRYCAQGRCVTDH